MRASSPSTSSGKQPCSENLVTAARTGPSFAKVCLWGGRRAAADVLGRAGRPGHPHGVSFISQGCAFGAAGGQQLTYSDALDGQAIRVLDAPCRLAVLAVHEAGTLLATGGEDGVIRLLNYDEGANLRPPACCPEAR